MDNDNLIKISNNIDLLFRLFGKPVDDVEYWVGEINKWNYEPKYILEGIEAMKEMPKRDIVISMLKNIVSSVAKPKEYKKTKCLWCEGTGIISMVDQKLGYNYSMNCYCENASKNGTLGLQTWNGKEFQRVIIKGEPLDLRLWQCTYFKRPMAAIEEMYKRDIVFHAKRLNNMVNNIGNPIQNSL